MIGTLQRRADTSATGALDGFKQMVPAALGVLPFATMIGVALGESPVSNFAGYVGGFFVAGGSAHLAAIGSMSVGTGMVATIVTALMINARGLVYGAALGPAFRSQPKWFRWVAAYSLVDQMFAVVGGVLERDDRYVRSFYVGAMSVLWTAYFGGVAIGMTVGPVIPSSIPLALCIPVLFLTMLVPGVKSRPSYAAAVVGLAVAILGSDLPSGVGLVAAIVLGTVAGVIAERWQDA